MARTVSADPREKFARGRMMPSGRGLRRFALTGLALGQVALVADMMLAPHVGGEGMHMAHAAATPRVQSVVVVTLTGLMLALLALSRIGPFAKRRVRPGVPDAPAAAPPGPHDVSYARREGGFPITTAGAEPMTGLLARVSHDLRTPLNAVMGFADLMQRETFGPLGNPRYQSYARHIHASSAELLKAAEDTLAMTSLVASQKVPATDTVSLLDLVDDTFTMARLQMGRELAALPPTTLSVAIWPTLKIRCERRALRQALINLMSAAIAKNAGAEGRTLRVSASSLDDVVRLSITVDQTLATGASLAGGAAISSWNSTEDLPVCLARALLELQGLPLDVATTGGTWRATVVLDGVVQQDLFGT
jgi:signal transduction histidine kinase